MRVFRKSAIGLHDYFPVPSVDLTFHIQKSSNNIDGVHLKFKFISQRKVRIFTLGHHYVSEGAIEEIDGRATNELTNSHFVRFALRRFKEKREDQSNERFEIWNCQNTESRGQRVTQCGPDTAAAVS